MLSQLINFLRLTVAYIRFNFLSQLEYRGAFISQVSAMFLNDCAWVAFWCLFFTRFPVIKGWCVSDVITLWAMAAAGFGLCFAICGNGLHLPQVITRGQLDVWMLYPRALLPHILIGRTNATAYGDVLFGYAVYLALVRPDFAHFLLFFCMTLSVAVLFIGFSVATGSLAFFIGNSEVLSEQWRFAMITFATYPFALFDGRAKLILFTIIPAAFVSYSPIEALHGLRLEHALAALLGSLAVLAVGVAIFYFGLRRYESGNLLEMRG